MRMSLEEQAERQQSECSQRCSDKKGSASDTMCWKRGKKKHKAADCWSKAAYPETPSSSAPVGGKSVRDKKFLGEEERQQLEGASAGHRE